MDPEKFQSIDAKLQENIIKTLAGLEELRHNWSGDIPSIDVHYGKFKVRHAWFQSVLLDIEDVKRLCSEGLIKISPQLLEKTELLEQLITSDDFKKRMTIDEDIKLADDVIDKILEELKK